MRCGCERSATVVILSSSQILSLTNNKNATSRACCASVYGANRTHLALYIVTGMLSQISRLACIDMLHCVCFERCHFASLWLKRGSIEISTATKTLPLAAARFHQSPASRRDASVIDSYGECAPVAIGGSERACATVSGQALQSAAGYRSGCNLYTLARSVHDTAHTQSLEHSII